MQARGGIVVAVLFLVACGGGRSSDGAGGAGGAAAGAAGDGGMAGAGAGGAGGSAGMGGTAGTPSGDWFDVWREMQTALRESPDHLIARADELVAEGDPERIYEFVRDRIQTVPPRGRAVDRETFFGARGTLRGGVGTPRDKAELLKLLYERAGLTATIEQWSLVAEKREVSVLFPPVVRPDFQLPDADAQADRWSAMVGVDAPATPFEVVDADGSRASALGAELAAMVTPPTTLEGIDALVDEHFPVVSVVIDGTEQFANPVVSDGVFGEHYLDALPLPAPSALTESVRVRFWARKAFGEDRDDPIVLVERNWPAHELLGRRVNVQARPPLSVVQLMPANVGDLTTFIPMLTVEGADLAIDDAESLGERGDAFTIRGDRLTWSADGTVTMNGLVLEDPGNPDAVSRVDSLQVIDVEANTFPDVRVRFAALDSGGTPVDGLTARDVYAEEAGTRFGGLLRKLPLERRVLFVYDGSTSVPAEFRDANLRAFLTTIATQVLAEPNTTMAVGSLGQVSRHPFVSTVAEVQAQYDDTTGTGSNVWTALRNSVLREPDAIVLVSDYEAVDSKTPEIEATLRQSSSRLVALGAGTDTPGETATLNEMISLVGGAGAPVTAHTEAVAQVLSTIPPVKANYELSYDAPPMGPTDRTVDIELEGASPSSQGNYVAQAVGATPPALIGLYATVEVGSHEVVRTIAGVRHEERVDTATAQDAADVHAALFGSTTLAFEGAAPPLSVIADDIVTARLAHEDLWDARDDFGGFSDALQSGLPSLPAQFYALARPLAAPDATEVSYPTGPRVIAYSRIPRFEAEGIESVDLMPFGHFKTLGPDPATAWRTTLDRTAGLAVTESAMFPTSTLSLLDGVSLEAIDPGDLSSRFDGTPADEFWERVGTEYARYGLFGDPYTLVVPSSGEPRAFYAVHLDTGTVIGVLEDGTGGGSGLRGQGELEERIRMLEALNNILNIAGFETGFWVELEIAKAKVVAYATLAILNLETWDVGDSPDWSPTGAGTNLACGSIRDAALERLPGASGLILANLNRALWFGLGGNDPVCD